MSLDAYVETDKNARIEVNSQDGFTVGSLLAKFLTALSDNFITNQSDSNEIVNWFKQPMELIPDIKLLADCWYAGDWKAIKDDYLKGSSSLPSSYLSLNDIDEIIEQISNKWTDLQVIIKIVEQLNGLIIEQEFPETWFYIRGETEKELAALENALRVAQKQDIKMIRILFL